MLSFSSFSDIHKRRKLFPKVCTIVNELVDLNIDNRAHRQAVGNQQCHILYHVMSNLVF